MQAERWALIGNAVTVPVAKWLGERLMQPYRCNTSTAYDDCMHACMHIHDSS